MSTLRIPKISPGALFGTLLFYFGRPFRLIKSYDRADLRPDLIAGLTLGIILIPQAIAFSLLAELPPVMGIYTAIVAAIVAALWGSSYQTYIGPTNALSVLILSVLITNFQPGTTEFMVAAGLMAVMVGVSQMIMGFARLGMLVNFVSHAVIVGFATGAGVLILIGQIRPLLGLIFASRNIQETLYGIVTSLPYAHWPTVLVGLGSIALIILLRRLNPRLPAGPITVVVASLVVYLFHLQTLGVSVIGELPSGLPPLADLPLFDLKFIARLSTGSLAVAAISLIATTAISRSIATQTGQRLDSNQEFIGQGLANIMAGFFSGYPAGGSFSLSAVNFKAGARTPLSIIVSSLFVLFAMLLLGPLAAYLPRAAMAGVLMTTAYGMIDWQEIRRIRRGTQGDAVIMLVTLFGTIFLPIEFAVLAGILLSFALYILRTSSPRVQPVLPDPDFRHFIYQPNRDFCPQLSILEILGDLYFGAVNFVEDAIRSYQQQHPEQRYLLIRLGSVNHCDFSGIHTLETIVRLYRDQGGDVYIVGTGYRIMGEMRATGFCDFIGQDHFLKEDEAIGFLFYRILDPAVCIYECPVRAFRECQNLPKREYLLDLNLPADNPNRQIATLSAQELWSQLHLPNKDGRPFVVDVREPREFHRGHIPGAELVPLPELVSQRLEWPPNQTIVFVCRTGRRSQRAACALQKQGYANVKILNGGMLAWETATLLEAVD